MEDQKTNMPLLGDDFPECYINPASLPYNGGYQTYDLQTSDGIPGIS